MKESVAVTLIEVPVTVVDRSGEPVRGLGASDFTLYDDGRKVDIEYFETIDVATAAPTTTTVNPATRLHVILLFDLSNSSPGTIERSREAAIDFVENELRDSDLVAVAVYSVEQGLRPLTSFTGDRELLQLAIGSLGHPKFFRVADPLFLSATSPSGEGTSAGQASGFDIGSEFLSISQEFDRMNRRIDEEYLMRRLEAQLESFGRFARFLDSVRGRKQIVLLSEGFEPRLIQGRESTAQQGMEELDAIASGEPWRVDLDQRYGFTSAKTELSKMGNLFKRSDVVMHAIDIKGLRTNVDARSGFGTRSNESLFLMTNPTGGQVFKNANDLSESFSQIMKQQSVVYLLGFPARYSEGEGSFHEIEVEVEGVPGARLTHRSGYYEPSKELTGLEKTLSLADVLINDIPRSEIDVATLAVPFPVDEEERWTVPVIAELDGAPLLEGVEGDTLDVDLFIYAFDENDSVHDFLHQKISLDLTKLRNALEQIGVKFYGVLRLSPGEYAVKTLARVDQTNRQGFSRHDVTIPAAGEPLLLRPLVLEEEGKWLMVKANPRSAFEQAYRFHVGLKSFVPSAVARIESGELQKLALFAYNLDYGAGLRSGIRSHDGSRSNATLSVAAHAPAEELEPAKLILELETSELDPGTYQLDVAVGEGEDRKVTSLPLTVIPRSETLESKPEKMEAADPVDRGSEGEE